VAHFTGYWQNVEQQNFQGGMGKEKRGTGTGFFNLKKKNNGQMRQKRDQGVGAGLNTSMSTACIPNGKTVKFFSNRWGGGGGKEKNRSSVKPK